MSARLLRPLEEDYEISPVRGSSAAKNSIVTGPGLQILRREAHGKDPFRDVAQVLKIPSLSICDASAT